MINKVFIGVVLVLLVSLGLLYMDRSRLIVKNEDLQRSIGIYQGQIQALNNDIKSKDSAIEEQNKAVEGLATEAARREHKVKQAQEAARISAQSNVKLADWLLQARGTSPDSCKNAEALINKYIEEVKAQND